MSFNTSYQYTHAYDMPIYFMRVCACACMCVHVRLCVSVCKLVCMHS